MNPLIPLPFRQQAAVIAAALAAVLVLAGCGGHKEPTNGGASPLSTASVRTQIAVSQSHAIVEEVVGTVRAKLQATLEAKVSGRIAQFPLVVGQRVTAGQLVARLDAAELGARLEQAEAAVEQAERDWKRMSALFEQQAVTRAEYDTAQSRNRLARGVAAEARAMMSYAEVVAPFDGVVTRKWAEVGDLANPGKALLALEDPSLLQLEADVPQAITAQVQRDAHLAVRMEGVADDLIGTVSEIAPSADPASRTLRVKVDLPARPGLVSGMFARLLVPVGQRTTIRVRASALVVRGQLEILFVVTNQKARMVLVRTGQRVGDEVEILAGLRANDVVVVEGAAQLTDGQPVEAK